MASPPVEPVRLSGWALVLGASSGFGEATSLALARAGLNVFGVHLDRRGTLPNVERIVGEIHAAGTAIVMTTHNLGLARRMADEVVFLHAGRITEQTPAHRFFQSPASPEAAQFLTGELPWNAASAPSSPG